MPSGVVGVTDIDDSDGGGSGGGEEKGGEGRGGHAVEGWEGLHGCAEQEVAVGWGR